MPTGTLAFTQGNGNCTDFTALGGLTVPQVASNQLSAVTVSTQYAGISNITLGPNMRIGISAAAIPGSSSALILFARVDSSVNAYGFEVDAAAWFINRYDAGVATQLQTGSFTSGADLVEVEIVGTTLRAFVDGVQFGTNQSVPLFTTNTKFGIFLFRGTGTLTADDMSYTDFFPHVNAKVFVVNRAARMRAAVR